MRSPTAISCCSYYHVFKGRRKEFKTWMDFFNWQHRHPLVPLHQSLRSFCWGFHVQLDELPVIVKFFSDPNPSHAHSLLTRVGFKRYHCSANELPWWTPPITCYPLLLLYIYPPSIPPMPGCPLRWSWNSQAVDESKGRCGSTISTGSYDGHWREVWRLRRGLRCW